MHSQKAFARKHAPTKSIGAVMTAAHALAQAAPPTLDALFAARTVWHAGRSAATASTGEPTGFDALDALLPLGGWPRNALTELLLPADGVGELALLLPTLAALTQAGGIVALIAPPYLPYAPAWQAAGVDLRLLEVVQVGASQQGARQALWAFEQCLRSAACAAVLGWPQTADARALRRLQVAAGSGECLGFALRDRRHADNPSPAALRIECVRDDATGGNAWRIRKCRGGNAPSQMFELPVGAASAATALDLGVESIKSSREQARSHNPERAGAASAATALDLGMESIKSSREQAVSHNPEPVGAALAATALDLGVEKGNSITGCAVRFRSREQSRSHVC
jgi:hypothetical protein